MQQPLKRMTRALVIYLLLSITTFKAHAQETGHLSRFSSALDVNDNDDFSSFRMLDTVLPKYRLFFTGEFHEEPGNTIIQWKFFRYLNAKTGLRTLVFELPVGIGYLLHYYLHNNDSDAYFAAVENSMEIDDRIFFARLYEFNKALPPEKKLILEGIDYEKSFELSIEALKLMLKNHPGMKTSGPEMNELLKMNWRTRDTTLQRWARGMYAKIKADSTRYAALLGDDHTPFLQVLLGIDCDEFEDAENSRTALDARELFLENNFMLVLKKYPGEKMFGQFGETHTCLRPNADWCYERNWSSFIAKANSDTLSPVKDSVFIASYVYRNNNYPGSFFPNLPQSTYLALRTLHNNAQFILAGPSDSLARAKGLGEKSPYLILVNFTGDDLKAHYRDPRNNTTNAIRNSGYYVDGVYFAFNQWGHSGIELGYFLGYQYFFNDQVGGAALSVEYVIDQKIYGSKLFFGLNVDPIHAGLNITYHTEWVHHSAGIMPQLGFGWKGFSLSYGYDWKLLGRLPEPPNSHTVSLKYIWAVSKQ